MDVPPPSEIEELLVVDHIDQLSVELTTDCNLACVYCHFAPLSRRGKNADQKTQDNILDFIKAFPISNHVTLSGDSEITLHPNWVDFSKKILGLHKASLRTISNFSKGVFSDEEADVLSQYKNILISLDVADHEKLKKIRYKADLRTISLNINKVRAFAIANDRPSPHFICNAVQYDISILEIDKTMAFAASAGFNYFNVPVFIPLDEVPGGINEFMDNPLALPVKSIKGLSKSDAGKALEAIDRAKGIALKHSITFYPSELIKILEGIRRGPKDTSLKKDANKPGTKRCLMPWNFIFVNYDGNIPPCCIVKDKSIGNLNERPLQDIVNGDEIKAWRRGLLTGNLLKDCQHCTYVPETSIEDLIKAVRDYLHP